MMLIQHRTMQQCKAPLGDFVSQFTASLPGFDVAGKVLLPGINGAAIRVFRLLDQLRG